MQMTELFLAELAREAQRSKRVLEQVPGGKQEWKPHDRSMAFGYLATLVATMPLWMAMQIQKDELDVAPKDGAGFRPESMTTSAEFVSGHERAVAAARAALEATTDGHLATPWRLLAAGQVVAEAPRHEMLRDTFNHLAHHRGQMTVYLRLLGAVVPALYGPSADDRRFA